MLNRKEYCSFDMPFVDFLSPGYIRCPHGALPNVPGLCDKAEAGGRASPRPASPSFAFLSPFLSFYTRPEVISLSSNQGNFGNFRRTIQPDRRADKTDPPARVDPHLAYLMQSNIILLP